MSKIDKYTLKELKPEHRVFAEQYVIDWNGTRSYMVAYPECDTKSAEASASRLLRDVKVSEYIEEIQLDLAKLAGISALSNLTELKKILTTKGEQTKDKIKAIEVINKMLDLNSPEKSEVKDTSDKPIEITFTKPPTGRKD